MMFFVGHRQLRRLRRALRRGSTAFSVLVLAVAAAVGAALLLFDSPNEAVSDVAPDPSSLSGTGGQRPPERSAVEVVPKPEPLPVTLQPASFDEAAMGAWRLTSASDPHHYGRWRSDLRETLSVDASFVFRPSSPDRYSFAKHAGPVTLSSGDRYRLKLTLSEQCFLYVFQVSGAGDLQWLFGRSADQNPVDSGARLIPEGGGWLELAGVVPGSTRLFLVASRHRLNRVEESARLWYADQGAPFRRQHLDDVLSLMTTADQLTEWLPGLVYGDYQFEHVPQEY